MSGSLPEISGVAPVAATAPNLKAAQASATASKNEQQAELKQQVVRFTSEIHGGKSAASLESLAGQISAAAASLGVTVNLPLQTAPAVTTAPHPGGPGSALNTTA